MLKNTQFVNLQNLYVEKRSENERNIVSSVGGLPGHEWQGKLEIKGDTQVMQEAFSNLKRLRKINVGGKESYGTTLTKEQIEKASFKIDNITVNSTEHEDIDNIHIIPCPVYSGEVTIATPRTTYSDIPFDVYGTGESMLVLLKTKTYTFIVDIKANVIDVNAINVSLTIKEPDFTPTYANYHSAKSSIEMMLDIADGGEFFVATNKGLEHSITLEQHHKLKSTANEANEYYELIHKIEKETNSKFEKLENFTPERYQAAVAIWHYLSNEAFEGQLHKNEVKKVLTVQQGIDKALVNKPGMVTLLHEIPPSFTLNGKTFEIPYSMVILPYARYTNCIKNDENDYTLTIEADSQTCFITFSDELGVHENVQKQVQAYTDEFIKKGLK